jgi:RNAse (barnase) inhibitor barstar
MDKKQFIINGDHFNNLNEFYNEIENVFTKNPGWKIGRNLDALSDVLTQMNWIRALDNKFSAKKAWKIYCKALNGGFGTFECGENIHIIWLNSGKSKNDFGYSGIVKFYKKAIILTIMNFRFQIVPELLTKIKKAKRHEGFTLFELVTETIKSRDNVNLVLK